MHTERRYELAVCAPVVAVFGAFWVVVFGLGDPPEFASQYLYSAVMVAVVATPWVIAARLLWRAWWVRNAAGLSAMDGPALLLSAAVAALPEQRRDWGRAMQAELTEVGDRASRWRFAAGCARTALLPPPHSRVPVLVVGVLAAVAVAAAAPVVGRALPAMQVFAVTFVALVGALATLAVARARRVRQVWSRPIITRVGVVLVAACIAVTAHFLAEYPAAAPHLPPSAAVLLAVVLTGCLWLALMPPRGLTTDRRARGLGAGAALALGLGFVVTSRLTVHTYGGPWVWVMFAPIVTFFVASALAAAAGRSFRAGVQTAVWTALLGTLLVFAVTLPEATRRYAIDGRTLGDGESGYPIGVNLPDAIWVLVVIPVLGLPFGVIGAAVGRRARGATPLGPVLAETRC